jgi:mRNA interferase RelE/StbE
VATYAVTILPSALGQLAELPRRDQKKIKERIDRLAVDPPLPGVKKLQGESKLFRLRSGNYRIISSIEDVRLIVLAIRTGHRRDVYRGLQRGTAGSRVEGDKTVSGACEEIEFRPVINRVTY